METLYLSSSPLLMLFPFSSSDYPSKLLYLRLCPFLFILLLFPTAASSALLHSWTPSVAYSDHCDQIVPKAPVDPSSATISGPSLRFDIGFFSGGDGFFDRNQPPNGLPKSATFSPISVRRTLGDDKVYKVEARLGLGIPGSFSSSSYYSADLGRRRLWRMQFKEPRIPVMGYRGGPSFGFSGFWSESTGRLCMVGSGSAYSAAGNLRSFNALLTLNYTKDSSIYGSLIRGILDSISDKGDESYFEPISILGVARDAANYEYKLLERGKADCSENRQESLLLRSVRGGLCSVFVRSAHMFRVRYETGCTGKVSCSPSASDIGYIPDFMSLFPDLCDKERMRMLLSFRNTSSLGSSFPFDPSTTLVAEGAWDMEKNRFCAVACRILNFSESLSNAVVDDCSLRLSLSFPAVLSIRRMGSVVGQLWSIKPENDPGYFSRIEFWSLGEPLWHFPSLRYEYTEIERVGKSCVHSLKRKGKGYPDAQTSDMRFHMSMRNNGGDTTIGYARATPLFVGDQLYRNLLLLGQGTVQHGAATNNNDVHISFTNISYRIRFSSDFNFGGDTSGLRGQEIYAEGKYDRDTGKLCMLGCQSLRLKTRESGHNDSLDCSIVIIIKFSPTQSQNDYRLKGTIESTREMKDPLYFGRVEILSKSIYASQAKASVWRMDLEITMVLISNTLSCVFVGLQLYHTKKHPESLPFVSIAMLVMLTLGHMIPLLLNFEALFKTNYNQQNMFFENDGWLEANEIVVRMVTMVAFLLEFRLLQLAWTARRNEGESKSIWDAEKKVFCVCLPLYLTGGLIAWLVNLSKSPYSRVYVDRPHSRHLLYRPFNLKRSYQRPSLWKDLKSYGGLMLDGFLLPQILFNAFSNSNEKALAASFYVGTTVVRSLPHAYDLYRGHSYGRLLDWSYIYANHKMDYYSTAWDIIIPCAGLLFAFLVFLQQQFGSRCFLPKGFREIAGYERVSGAASLELQEAADQKNSDRL